MRYFVVLIFIIASCSPHRSALWHQRRLDKICILHPELFQNNVIDTLIKENISTVKIYAYKDVDSVRLYELIQDSVNTRLKLDSVLMKVYDRDTISRYVKKHLNAQGHIRDVYKNAKCKIRAYTLDTLGVRVELVELKGTYTLKVTQKEIHVRKPCPPCIINKGKYYWQYWQFWAWLSFPTLILILIAKWILKLKVT